MKRLGLDDVVNCVLVSVDGMNVVVGSDDGVVHSLEMEEVD